MGKLTIEVKGRKLILMSSSGKSEETETEEEAIKKVTDWIYRGW